MALPTRHREAEERGRRLARPLVRATKIDARVDEALMDRIGAALLEQDDVGAELAAAMRLPNGDPQRVERSALRAAISGSLPDDAPQALARFMAAVHEVPEWVDWDLVDEGARVFSRLGQNADDVLLQLSLIGGYRFGGPTDLLVQTGGLAGRRSLHRLAETQYWTAALGVPGNLRPGGEGWRLTVHVRAMHAMVNAALEPTWDTERWGLPINMADQAGTLGLFDGVLLVGARALGVPINQRDAHAMLHMWRYAGWVMGVHPDFLDDDETARHRLNLHVLLAAANLSDAGPPLAQRLVRGQLERHFARTPRLLRPIRARYEYERLLSMLTVFLGVRSMREFELPLRPPWAIPLVHVQNAWRYRVRAHLPGGRARLEQRGRRTWARNRLTYRPIETGDVGPLPER